MSIYNIYCFFNLGGISLIEYIYTTAKGKNPNNADEAPTERIYGSLNPE